MEFGRPNGDLEKRAREPTGGRERAVEDASREAPPTRDKWTCGICATNYYIPILGACGHTRCASCTVQAYEGGRARCPKCAQIDAFDAMVPNYSLIESSGKGGTRDGSVLDMCGLYASFTECASKAMLASCMLERLSESCKENRLSGIKAALSKLKESHEEACLEAVSARFSKDCAWHAQRVVEDAERRDPPTREEWTCGMCAKNCHTPIVGTCGHTNCASCVNAERERGCVDCPQCAQIDAYDAMDPDYSLIESSGKWGTRSGFVLVVRGLDASFPKCATKAMLASGMLKSLSVSCEQDRLSGIKAALIKRKERHEEACREAASAWFSKNCAGSAARVPRLVL